MLELLCLDLVVDDSFAELGVLLQILDIPDLEQLLLEAGLELVCAYVLLEATACNSVDAFLLRFNAWLANFVFP